QSEFIKLQQIIYSIAGIHMTEAKKPLMSGRLYKRLRHHQLTSYADYISLLSRDHEEVRVTVDLLTTNETHFFGDPNILLFCSSRCYRISPVRTAFVVGAQIKPAGKKATVSPCFYSIR